MPEPTTPVTYDCIIIGGGAAGLAAAVYAGRYLMRTLVLEGLNPGGETAVAWTVENYPGVPSVDGAELVARMRAQAQAAGAELVAGEAAGVAVHDHCFSVSTPSGATYLSRTLILAHGSHRRRLGLPRERELTGHGVSYCATCDGPLYRGKRVGIVGGGDASVKGAILVARYAREVVLMVRGDALTAEPVNRQVFDALANVQLAYGTEVVALEGGTKLAAVQLSQPYGGSNRLELDGLFVEIGSQPNTELPQKLGLTLDARGYLEVDPMMRTNVDGVYAAGDITNETGSFKQDIVAAAQGAIAATSAYQDIGLHGREACLVHARAVSVAQ